MHTPSTQAPPPMLILTYAINIFFEKMDSDTTIVIPVLNEITSIEKLLETLDKLYPGVKIIVVDDGSKDGTGKKVRDMAKTNVNVFLLDRANAQIHGLTASVIEGILSSRTEFVVVMDGDLQHPPETVKEILYLLRRRG